MSELYSYGPSYAYEPEDNFTPQDGHRLATEAQFSPKPAAEAAARTLVERHLYIPEHLARLSLDLPTKGHVPGSLDPDQQTAPWRFAHSHWPWVHHTISQSLPTDFTELASPPGELDDRMQAGYEGLINAVYDFQPRRHQYSRTPVPFSEWAAPAVKQAILATVEADTPEMLPLHHVRLTNLNPEEADEHDPEHSPNLAIAECLANNDIPVVEQLPFGAAYYVYTSILYNAFLDLPERQRRVIRAVLPLLENERQTLAAYAREHDTSASWLYQSGIRAIRERMFRHFPYDKSEEGVQAPVNLHRNDGRLRTPWGTGASAVRVTLESPDADGREHIDHV